MMMWKSWTVFILIITCIWEVTCNGWSTVFIVPKSQKPEGYTSIQQLWQASGSYGNDWNFRSAIDTNVIFKSPILDVWNEHNVLSVKLSAYTNNREAAYVVFNATGKTKNNWFDCDNILDSSYTDIKPEDISKCKMTGRRWRFKINHSHGRCESGTGWLMFKDFDTSGCEDWDVVKNTSYFYYSKTNTYITWNTGDRGIADAMVISLSMVHVALPRAIPVVNGSTTIYCGSTAFPIMNVMWMKDGNNIQNVSRYSGGDRTTPSLTISDLQMSDAGVYTCILTTINGTGQDSVTLNVIDPVVLVDLQSSPAVVNKKTTIDCVSTVFSITNVKWKKEGTDIQTHTPQKYSGGNTSTPSLTIYNLNKSDEGMYTCILTTAIWIGQDSVQLIVIDRPSVNVHLSPGKPVVDSHTTIHCNSSDFPVTNVSWTKDGYNIESLSCDKYCGGNIEIPSLTIHYLNMSDSGEYTCTLTNIAGSASGNVSLSVIDAPVVDVTISTTTLPKENSQTTIYCDSTEFEVTHVSWKKDGEDITLPCEMYSGGNVTKPSLTINNLQRSDTGEYTCILGNDAGETESSVKLTVIAYPLVTVNLPYKTLPAGVNVRIDCTCTQCHVTNVTWMKDGSKMNVQTGKYDGGTSTIPTLTIYNIQTSDTGTYTCILTNAVGSGEDNVTLTVVDTSIFRPELSKQVEKIIFWLNSTNQQSHLKKIQQKVLRKLKNSLEIGKKNITSFKRTKISARDDRVSSAATGCIAVAFLAFVLGSIVLSDIVKLVKFLKSFVVEHKSKDSQ